MTTTYGAGRVRDVALRVMKNWERMVSLSLGDASGERFESFVYSAWDGWRPVPQYDLVLAAAEYGWEDGKFPATADERAEVVACAQLLSSSEGFEARPQDVTSALFDLDTLKVEQGVPWINEVVTVSPVGDVSTRRQEPPLFCRRPRVDAKWVTVSDCPEPWSEALKAWGAVSDEGREYASALVGLTLTEFPQVLGVIHVWNESMGHSMLTDFVRSLAGGADSHADPASLASTFGTSELLRYRMVHVGGKVYVDDAQTRRGIEVIRALATRSRVEVDRGKDYKVWEGQLPVRVWWETPWQHPWLTPALTYGIEVLPLPVNHEPLDPAAKAALEETLQGAQDEIASYCVEALSRWVKAGTPIPARIKEALEPVLIHGL